MGLAVADGDDLALKRREGFVYVLFVVKLLVPPYFLPLEHKLRGKKPFWKPGSQRGIEGQGHQLEQPGDKTVKWAGLYAEVHGVAVVIVLSSHCRDPSRAEVEVLSLSQFMLAHQPVVIQVCRM